MLAKSIHLVLTLKLEGAGDFRLLQNGASFLKRHVSQGLVVDSLAEAAERRFLQEKSKVGGRACVIQDAPRF